jgi:hypothetical protein
MAKNIAYYVRPECPREDRVGKELGPFPDFLQLTYEDLRIGPDGDVIAQYNLNTGHWCFRENFRDNNEEWSDIVIYAKDG